MYEVDTEHIIGVLQTIINTIKSGEWDVEDGRIDISNDLIDGDWIICGDSAYFKKPISRGKKYNIEFYLKAR